MFSQRGLYSMVLDFIQCVGLQDYDFTKFVTPFHHFLDGVVLYRWIIFDFRGLVRVFTSVF